MTTLSSLYPAAAGGGLTWAVQATSTTAEADNGYLVDASGGDITITLPASPSAGDTVGVCDAEDQATTNTITVAGNSSNIEGSASDFIIDVDGSGLTFVYYDATIGWKIVSEVGTLSSTDFTTVDINNQTDNYTLVLLDAGKTVEMEKATAVTLTIPANASVPFPTGTAINIVQTGAGQVTVAITTDTLSSNSSYVKLAGQWSAATIYKRASTQWVLIGDIVA